MRARVPTASDPRAALPLVALAVGAAAAARPARAQLVASEAASVTQVVDGTRMEVRYSRPRLRGRRDVFGTRIPWGEIWTAGANQATTLAVSKPVTLEGQPVAAGRYSVWLIPARTGPWELVLDHDTTLFHTQGPKPRPGQVRVPVRPARGALTEVLTWSFPEVGSTGATLAMQWDTVDVPLHVRVTPTHTTAVAADAATPVVGRYRVHFNFPDASGPRDTTLTAPERPARDVTLDVHYEGGELRARMTPPLMQREAGGASFTDWLLAPRRPGYYALGRVQGGEVVEYVDGMLLAFTTAGGRTTGLELRSPNDFRIAEGTRVP
ncbi:hypothetical protein tb265_06320 [Gemmatimonadetes bacterium T265]|nr:hypothetical protein tb265_06320 [Gemmatimonadetes bacterium T265]